MKNIWKEFDSILEELLLIVNGKKLLYGAMDMMDGFWNGFSKAIIEMCSIFWMIIRQ